MEQSRQVADTSEDRPASVEACSNTSYQSQHRLRGTKGMNRETTPERSGDNQSRLQNQRRQQAPVCPFHGAFQPGQNRATLQHREAPEASSPAIATRPHPKDSGCWLQCKRTRDCAGCNCRVAETVVEEAATSLGLSEVNDGTFQKPQAGSWPVMQLPLRKSSLRHARMDSVPSSFRVVKRTRHCNAHN